MKTILILLSATAFAAFLILPLSGEIGISLSFATGLALLLSADYGRQFNPLARTRTAPRSRESLRLAA